MVLQRLGYLNGTSTVCIGFYHTNHLRLRLQERTEMVQVIHHRVKVNLQNRFMHFLFQQLANALKAKGTGTLQQYNLIMQRTEEVTLNKLIYIIKEVRDDRRMVGGEY